MTVVPNRSNCRYGNSSCCSGRAERNPSNRGNLRGLCALALAVFILFSSTSSFANAQTNVCFEVAFERVPAGAIIDSFFQPYVVGIGITFSTNDQLLHPLMVLDSNVPTESDIDLGTPNEAFGGPGAQDGGGFALSNNVSLDHTLILTANKNQIFPKAYGSGGLVQVDLSWTNMTFFSMTVIDIDQDGDQPDETSVTIRDANAVDLISDTLALSEDNGVITYKPNGLLGVSDVAQIVVSFTERLAFDNFRVCHCPSSSESCVYAVCGDGEIQADEECDNGEENSSEPQSLATCNTTCHIVVPNLCGNNILDGTEECDLGDEDVEGNSNAPASICNTDCEIPDVPACAQSCIASCATESTLAAFSICYATCIGASSCPGGCGNGILESNEQCDESVLFNSNQPNATCRTNCQAARCGDGILDSSRAESCDLERDNSDIPDSECRLDCTFRRCGDGIQDSDEECDFGELFNSDQDGSSCSTKCEKLQEPFNCVTMDFEVDSTTLTPLLAGDLIGPIGGLNPYLTKEGVRIVSTFPTRRVLMIYNTSNPTAGTEELGTPNNCTGGPGLAAGNVCVNSNDRALKNALIVSADGNTNNPRPRPRGGRIRVNFAALSTRFFVIDFIDSDITGGNVRTFSIDRATVARYDIPIGSDNSVIELRIPHEKTGVKGFDINLVGPTAVSRIQLCEPDCKTQCESVEQTLDCLNSCQCNICLRSCPSQGIPALCESFCQANECPDACVQSCFNCPNNVACKALCACTRCRDACLALSDNTERQDCLDLCEPLCIRDCFKECESVNVTIIDNLACRSQCNCEVCEARCDDVPVEFPDRADCLADLCLDACPQTCDVQCIGSTNPTCHSDCLCDSCKHMCFGREEGPERDGCLVECDATVCPTSCETDCLMTTEGEERDGCVESCRCTKCEASCDLLMDDAAISRCLRDCGSACCNTFCLHLAHEPLHQEQCQLECQCDACQAFCESDFQNQEEIDVCVMRECSFVCGLAESVVLPPVGEVECSTCTTCTRDRVRKRDIYCS